MNYLRIQNHLDRQLSHNQFLTYLQSNSFHYWFHFFHQTAFAFVLAKHFQFRFDSELVQTKDQTVWSSTGSSFSTLKRTLWHVGQGAGGLCKSSSPLVTTSFFTSLSARCLFPLKFCYISSVGPCCRSWKSSALVMERLLTERALCVWESVESFALVSSVVL